MTEHELPGLSPGSGSGVQAIDMDIVTGAFGGIDLAGTVVWKVTHAARNIERRSGWVEGDAVVGVRDHHDLLLDRRVGRNVIDEHILLRVGPVEIGAEGVHNVVGFEDAVVPAR